MEERHHLILHSSNVLHNCITGHHHFKFTTLQCGCLLLQLFYMYFFLYYAGQDLRVIRKMSSLWCNKQKTQHTQKDQRNKGKEIAEYDLNMVVSDGINSSCFIIMSSLAQKASPFLFGDPAATANYSRAMHSHCWS